MYGRKRLLCAAFSFGAAAPSSAAPGASPAPSFSFPAAAASGASGSSTPAASQPSLFGATPAQSSGAGASSSSAPAAGLQFGGSQAAATSASAAAQTSQQAALAVQAPSEIRVRRTVLGNSEHRVICPCGLGVTLPIKQGLWGNWQGALAADGTQDVLELSILCAPHQQLLWRIAQIC